MSSFSEKQEYAFNAYLEGKNVFISGPGGTGKSYFIKKVYDHATTHAMKIVVTSLTGCSAANLYCGATTIHKWCGFIVKDDMDIVKTTQNIRKYGHRKKYKDVQVLVIDEISMMDQQFFEVLDYQCKIIRNDQRPFGGIQLICCADFFQLPPISKNKETMFCFESPLWDISFNEFVLFDENFRQKGDDEYYKILQNVRKGIVTHEDFEKLLSCTKKDISHLVVKPTILFPTKGQADEINMTRLNSLSNSSTFVFHSKYQQRKFSHTYKNELGERIDVHKWIDPEKDIPNNEMKTLEKQLSNMMCGNEQTFKVGAQVMCIANLDQELGIVNGAQGIITRFELDETDGVRYPYVKFENYAFEKKVKRHVWINDTYDELGISQIPLILSWAITIHKSQGITLDKAYIDVGGKVFEHGQTYVALSRVKSLEGLYLKSFNPRRIRANPKVVKFYENDMRNNSASHEPTYIHKISNIVKNEDTHSESSKVQKKTTKNTTNKSTNIKSFFH